MAAVVNTNKWEAATLDYSQEGLKSHIQFLVTDVPVTGTDAAGTLMAGVVAAIGVTEAGNPARGTNHPYFNGEDSLPLLQADVIHAKARDAKTVEVDVDYAVLNGMTQEPSGAGDVAAALLTVASSLQSYEAIVDFDGNPIQVPYYTTGRVNGALTFTCPSSNVALTQPYLQPGKAHTQLPSMILRFQRRETTQRDGSNIVGIYNKDTFDAGVYGSFPPCTLLCTRVENVTRDEGFSWIVTYEFTFQFTVTQPTGGVNFQPPAFAPATGEMSAWDVGLYWQMPTNYQANSASGINNPGPEHIPSDAIPTIFAVLGNDDGTLFAALNLLG